VYIWEDFDDLAETFVSCELDVDFAFDGAFDGVDLDFDVWFVSEDFLDRLDPDPFAALVDMVAS